YRGRLWSYLLPPGWRELKHTTIADVAARQYVAAYENALTDIKRVPQELVTEITYESLVSRPVPVIEALLEDLRLPPSAEVVSMASDLSKHEVQVNSPPRPDKWKQRADEVARIFPTISPTTRRLGYKDTLDL
ncbi:MAG TPA: hypothetical protein VFD47_10225, partial [Actinomycetota bacterium]|nr:hypothetical protein [Actinomycetota bacterium]